MGDKLFLGVSPIPWVLITLALLVLKYYIIQWAVYRAYDIRMYAIKDYGSIIHEFDPWFNYRATEYLEKYGSEKFLKWFDYESWWPLGRPVGTTIYPGMQYTAVWIYRYLQPLIGLSMTLMEVCCHIPCWFGAIASLLLGLVTYEGTRSTGAATLAVAIMAIIPAHIMRSVGGGYDNESIAMTAMLATFYFWMLAQRQNIFCCTVFGLLAGVAYGYMVAAWGGYVFVLNMVALHALYIPFGDWFRNQYSSYSHIAYTIFYVVGTAIAVQIPVVGWTPLKSLEQLGAFAIFVGYQILAFSEIKRRKLDLEIRSVETLRHRCRTFLIALGIAVVVIAIIVPRGFFGPMSARVRGLFVQHTRTGNPLVDSVAEHQPATAGAYWHYLHAAFGFAHIGFIICAASASHWRGRSFLVMYAVAAYFFSLKMSRLIILAGPPTAALAALCLSSMFSWCFDQFCWTETEDAEVEEERKALAKKTQQQKGRKTVENNAVGEFGALWREVKFEYRANRTIRMATAVFFVFYMVFTDTWYGFARHADEIARSMSNPQVVYKAQMQDGTEVLVNDYLEAYEFLRDETPEDSRVMAWWDYGYQITGIGRRTSIADGNTWNHEHIATLGYCLTSPTKQAHKLIRHLADYVLVWTGGGGDDLAKSPHMARIGNSVYRDLCPGDPTCQHFGFEAPDANNNARYDKEKPTKSMRASLLYNLNGHGWYDGVNVSPKLFQEVFTSKYRRVRIYKVMNVSAESKAWNMDPKNRICDAPGSWYCPGQYPPAKPIQDLLKKKSNFKQVEDFNQGGADEEYHEAYMKKMQGRG